MAINFIKIPLSDSDCTPELINNLRNIGLVSESLVVWNTPTEWFNSHFWGPLLDIPSDLSKPNKNWDIRNVNLPGVYYRFAKNPDGSWMKWQVVGQGKPTSDQNVVETFRQPDATNPTAPVNMIQVLGQEAQNLFAEYGTKIVAIPQLEAVYISNEDIHKQNYQSSGFTQLPVNTTWPRQFIPMFGPDGNPCLVKMADYIANTPKPGTTGTGKYTEAEIGAAIRRNVGFLDDVALGKYAKTLALA